MHPFTEIRFREDDIPGKNKPQGKTDAKGDNIGGNMGTDRPLINHNILFVYYIIETDKVEENVEQLV